MTESEELFCRFCKSQGWRVERIDEHSVPQGSKVPDFHLLVGDGAGIVVEVKQFDPNPEEREAAQGKGSGVLGGKPGQRLREVIPKANNQLKALGRSEPGMLVVYNRTPCALHDDPYAVLTAMRGLDVIEYHVPADPGSPIVRGRERLRSRQEADSRHEHIGVLRRRAARVLRWRRDSFRSVRAGTTGDGRRRRVCFGCVPQPVRQASAGPKASGRLACDTLPDERGRVLMGTLSLVSLRGDPS